MDIIIGSEPSIECVTMPGKEQDRLKTEEKPIHSSTITKNVGKLSIICAAIGLSLGSLESCSAIVMMNASRAGIHENMLGPDGKKVTQQEYNQQKANYEIHAARYRASAWSGLVVFMLSLGLLFIGKGQKKRKPWANRWSLYWAILTLVNLIVIFTITLLMILQTKNIINGSTIHSATITWDDIGQTVAYSAPHFLLIIPYPLFILMYLKRRHLSSI